MVLSEKVIRNLLEKNLNDGRPTTIKGFLKEVGCVQCVNGRGEIEFIVECQSKDYYTTHDIVEIEMNIVKTNICKHYQVSTIHLIKTINNCIEELTVMR